MTAKLIAEDGFLKGLELSLEQGEQWVIGRDPATSQLVVEDASVSRQHAICRHTPEGITIDNLSATNPLQINGKEITAPYLLKQGDTVKIGSIGFRFYDQLKTEIDEFPEGQQQEANQSSSQEANAPSEPAEAAKAAPPPTPAPTPPAGQEEPEDETHHTIFDEGGASGRGDGSAMLADIDFNLSEAGRWLLKVISGPNNGAEFSLQADTAYTIGTDPNSCDIVFQDVSVSRQHARIAVSKEETVTVEDLKSRNGTFVDGTAITDTKPITADAMVTLGTTTFVILDREGERTTMAAPILPSIAKALAVEEPPAPVAPEGSEAAVGATPPEESPAAAKEKEAAAGKVFNTLAAVIIVALMASVLIIVSVGIRSLFKTEEVVKVKEDVNAKLEAILKPFAPGVRYSFNERTGTLLLLGHVQTSADRTQLLYALQDLAFIHHTDDNIIVDELVWQDTNQVLAKNPAWRSISIHSPVAGKFVLSGYLKTRKQAEQLSEYLTQNFSYLDLLENRLIVEEDLDAQIDHMLLAGGLQETAADFSDGVVILHGAIQKSQQPQLDALIEKIKAIPGVRSVKSLVKVVAPAEGITNISSKYSVTGFSHGNGKTNVVIGGRILFVGDTLDGMIITKIEQNVIYLEKDGNKYKIEYNK